ncbi:hypothetical protein HYT05_04195 [Candidatus Kaiserbacteria bacterium]|nr:hypothetical protein [Candidatus Kaiserbacteria bacterium]
MAWDRKAPFNKKGELINYAWVGQGEIEWRNADDPMDMTLHFAGFERGRSAAHAIWKDEQGRRFVMFLTDLDDLINTGDPIKAVRSTWVVTKKGQDYGIKLAPQE